MAPLYTIVDACGSDDNEEREEDGGDGGICSILGMWRGNAVVDALVDCMVMADDGAADVVVTAADGEDGSEFCVCRSTFTVSSG